MNEKEILKILKDSVYNREVHKRVLSTPKGEKFMTIGLSVRGDENIAKVKEWLEHEDK